MKVLANSFTLNDPQDDQAGVYLSSISGLGIPPIRTSAGNYAGRDGGYVGAQLLSMRSIGLVGQLFASDVATLEARRADLQEALRSREVTLELVTNAGASYVVYCRLMDFQLDIKRDLYEADFKIELVAPDPTIYDNTSGGELVAAFSRRTSGGYAYPVAYPVQYQPATPATTVTNAGNSEVYPRIILSGVMTNPVVTNLTTGGLFALNLTTGAGDQVVVDMRQRTVTLNGGNIYGLSSGTSDFWPLDVGANDIELITGNGGDTVTGELRWRNGFVGI